MDNKTILSKVDHTLLSQTAARSEIFAICDDGIKYGAASVCIPPCRVKEAFEYVQGKIRICTVIGFPNGYQTTAVKAFEAEEAIKNGADEIDMVINIGAVKDKDYEYISNEIAVLRKVCDGKILKVIIETCFLDEYEKIRLCGIVTEAGADYIKTSTGFGTGGAKLEDVILMRENVGENVKIKAAGGISSLSDAEKFIEAGASRLGTSRIIKIIKSNNV